ncbi:hypothetical protein GCM10011297_01650 [Bacterioplanes sanyensis]|uniref:DUF885 family protein n=1 Tax=Bacterioplanes sanyensis TaxID=1249553 RepID=UPI00167603FC|nr:DUF885 family protein [Bacterioplanes sanyensis]GGY32411.1 hypothetical protein GCM10011297_01650 [Bacterioplanes sanyensis]
MPQFLPYVLTAALVALSGCSLNASNPQATATTPVINTQQQQQSRQQFDQYWQQYQQLRYEHNPLLRSQLSTQSDFDWDDLSDQGFEQRLQDWQDLRQQLNDLPRAALTNQQRRRYDALLTELEQRLLSVPFRTLALDLTGPQAWQRVIPHTLTEHHPVASIRDAHDYIDRLQSAAALLGHWQQLWQAAEPAFLPPRTAFDQALADIDALLTGAPFTGKEDSPLWADINTKIVALPIYPSSERVLKQRAQKVLENELQPALQQLRNTLTKLRNQATDAPALSQHEDGLRYYQLLLSRYSDSHWDAQHWHDQAQQRVRARQQEWLQGGELTEGQTFSQILAAAPRITDPQAAVVKQREVLRQAATDLAVRLADVKLPPLAVSAVASNAQPWADITSYRPGHYRINPKALNQLSEAQLAGLSLRQGLASHWQYYFSQQPQADYLLASPATVAGWQAYAARLMLYRNQQWRRAVVLAELNDACMAVVDTGLHALQWSYQQAENYLSRNCNLSEAQRQQQLMEIQDQPGRAVAALAGLQHWQQLGEQAEKASWLEQLLQQGPLPLDDLLTDAQ